MRKKESAVFTVTEWDWFKVRVRLCAVEQRAEMCYFSFAFDDAEHAVVCRIGGQLVEEVLRETRDKDVLFEEYFAGWVSGLKRDLRLILTDTPVLCSELDLDRDVVFEVIWSYGMGGALICTIVGDEAKWDDVLLEDFYSTLETSSTSDES